MTASRDPVRLRARLDGSSSLGRALEAAQAAGPDEEQLKALEQRVLACVGAATVASTAIAVAAAAKAPAAGAATGVATGLSAGSVKLLLAAVGVAAITGGSTLVWQASRGVPGPGTGAAPARVQAKGHPVPVRPLPTVAEPAPAALPTQVPREAPAAPAAPAAGQPEARTRATVAQPRNRTPPTVAQPEGSLLPPRAPTLLPHWSRPVDEPAPAPSAVGARATDDAYARIAPARTAEVDDEIPLIERAHGALTSNPGLALSLAEEHTRRFPQSSLDQERELIAITAMVRLGRLSQARTQALHFANRHPESAYNGQIQKMIKTGEP